EIAYSWRFGAPTALNQKATSVVSKRIKLNEELAFSCRKLPVSLNFRGSICCAIQLHSSRSHPGLANGPSLPVSVLWERALRALQISQESCAARKESIISEEMGTHKAVWGTGPSGRAHSIAWK